LEKLKVTDTTKRFPQFTFPESFEVLFEPGAGFIPPETAIRLYASQAEKNGATINTNEKVTDPLAIGVEKGWN
jgi:glycine/D-amino acid oxidase-like deaminating enzyme